MNDFVDYALEVHGIATYGHEHGFIQYTLPRLEQDPTGIVLDIQRIFVKKEFRGNKSSSVMVDDLISKLKADLEGKEFKLRKLAGHVHQNDANKETSLVVQLKYGFKIAQINQGNILLLKEL